MPRAPFGSGPSHAGGRVHIELSDDGRGVDPQRLAARAVVAGVLSRAEADALSASSALQLMFLPGLSTKDEITTVSGRGVGMDAVRTGLDQLGGQHRGLVGDRAAERSFASTSR